MCWRRLSETGLQADLEAAEARAAQARADLATIEAGGKQIELTTIDNDLARVRAEKEHGPDAITSSLRRLADKQAATTGGSADERESKVAMRRSWPSIRWRSGGRRWSTPVG